MPACFIVKAPEILVKIIVRVELLELLCIYINIFFVINILLNLLRLFTLFFLEL